MTPDEGFRAAEAFVLWVLISVLLWLIWVAGAMAWRSYHMPVMPPAESGVVS